MAALHERRLKEREDRVARTNCVPARIILAPAGLGAELLQSHATQHLIVPALSSSESNVPHPSGLRLDEVGGPKRHWRTDKRMRRNAMLTLISWVKCADSFAARQLAVELSTAFAKTLFYFFVSLAVFNIG